MSQVVDDALAAGRAAGERKEWSEAYELLKQADAETALGASDLELFAVAALWAGEFKDVLSVMERTYAALLQEGEKAKAAYIAVELAHHYSGQLQQSVAKGWMSRAKRLLDEEPEGAAHGYWALRNHSSRWASTISTEPSLSPSRPRRSGSASETAISKCAECSGRDRR
jgi:hypothetical protein